MALQLSGTASILSFIRKLIEQLQFQQDYHSGQVENECPDQNQINHS
jgi:hypothetical protein